MSWVLIILFYGHNCMTSSQITFKSLNDCKSAAEKLNSNELRTYCIGVAK